ncbi:MAG: efflux RND transporter permease subunit [Phycisphaeraceae bacterium]|nr:MAG: efflux RND transporter permease subunit [Phycisphaeraceae bacterium]
MDLVRLSINKPVAVTVGVILIVMFGLIGLTAIPIQLTPTVDRPVITVTTVWPGRSPQEIVDEVVKKQEEELKNVTNLRRMTSTTSQGMGAITLEFYIGSDISRAQQEVSDSLRQVPDYPEEVEEPRITVADGASENAIAWIIVDLDPDSYAQYPGFDISEMYDALDKEVKPELERIDGVAEVNIYGGREREARVYADSYKLAQRGLNHLDLVNALRRENQNTSAGTISESKRDYRVRLIGQYESTEQILETVIAYRDGNPVYVKDVATVELGYQKRVGFVRSFGHPVIAMNVIRQSDANVVDIMKDLRGRLDEIRAEILPNIAPEGFAEAGKHLRMRQVYDETTYIDSAMGLVTQNLWIGGAIAGVVLMVFLRSIVSTSIIAIAIPVSVIGTFLILLAMGRTLNVISLAGLAFAVGMVVDNAIVVLENIYRRIQAGDAPMNAAWRGGAEVWGAVLASTLTTAAVFIPVLTIREEAGQLFRDIALAIVASVMLSLVVSITVIPAAAARWVRPRKTYLTKLGRWWGHLFGLDVVFGALVRGLADLIGWMMTGWRGWTVRPLVIVAMTAASLAGAVLLAPPLDYLPAGNRNLVFGGLLIPPGLSVEYKEQLAQRIEKVVKPYVDASVDDPASVAALDPINRFPINGEPVPPFKPVPMENFFIGAFGSRMFVGGTSEVPTVVIPVGQLLTDAIAPIPDTYGGARQSSIFGHGPGGGSGNSVDVEISGPDLDRVIAAANMMFRLSGAKYGFTEVSPNPGNFNLQQQEYQVTLTDRARELGVRNQDVGTVIRSLFDGAYAGEYKMPDRNIDIDVVPTGGRLAYKEQLLQIPVATPAGPVVPLDSIVDVTPALAPQDIQRVEELPAVTLSITPPQGVPVEQMQKDLETYVIGPAREAGLIDRSMRINMEGTAAKLNEVQGALFGGGEMGAKLRPASPALYALTSLVSVAGLGVALFAGFKAVRKKSGLHAWGIVGALAIAAMAGLPLLAFALDPGLILARMVWALIVTYLLMAALFESFIYPFVIMFSVPLAIVGGFGGLAIVHAWSLADPTKAPQQLDVLTMLGFVILIGVVVNNAILLVHQALNFMHGIGEADHPEPMEMHEAVRESVRTRIRPIFMSVLTSVGGMLPLVLYPGAGSEMYRGLGSVVVGGLLVSTIFTLVLVPLMFSMTLEAMAGLKAVFTNGRAPAPATASVGVEPKADSAGRDEPSLQAV